MKNLEQSNEAIAQECSEYKDYELKEKKSKEDFGFECFNGLW